MAQPERDATNSQCFRFVCIADEQTDAQPRRSVGERRGFFSGDVAPERRTRPSTCQTVCGRGAASTAVVVLFTFCVVTIPGK